MAYIKPLDWKEMKPETLEYVKRMGRICYPSYKGRKWSLGFQESYTMENFWDGGSKTYAVAVDLTTGRTSQPSHASSNPMDRAAHANFPIPPGFGIMESIIFCGKSLGLRLVIRPDETRVIGYVPQIAGGQ